MTTCKSKLTGKLTLARLTTRSHRQIRIVLTGLITMVLISPIAKGQAVQSLESIKTAATQFVRQEARARNMQIRKVESGRLDARLKLAACAQPLTTFNPYNVPFSHRTTVGVRCDGKKPWTIYVPVNIVTEVTVLTVISPLSRGSIIGPNDVAAVKQTDVRGDVAYLVNPEDAIGKQTARPLARGTLLLANYLHNPRLIKRGESTSIIVRAGGISVKTRGQALQDGALGDWIALNNARSGQRVEGQVQADGSVIIR